MADPRDAQLRDAAIDYLRHPKLSRELLVLMLRGIVASNTASSFGAAAADMLRVILAVEAFGPDVEVCGRCECVVPALGHRCFVDPEAVRRG